MAPSCSPVDSVELAYAGISQSADDLIISIMNGHNAPRRITLVTNDNAIKKVARVRRCKTMSSEKFIDRLAGSLDSPVGIPHPSAKPDLSPVPADQVAGWLEEFGLSAEELAADPIYRELLALTEKPVERKQEQSGDVKGETPTEKVEGKPLALPKGKSKIKRSERCKNRKPRKSPLKTVDLENILSADIEEQLKKFWPPPGL